MKVKKGVNKKKVKTVEDIIKNKEAVLKRRKKKKKRKNLVLMSLFLISILTTMCLKLPQFLIKSVEVGKTKNLDRNLIQIIGEKAKNKNIFLLDKNSLESEIKQNKYVKDIKIKRKFPNKIFIDITENDSEMYLKGKDNYLIIDSNGNLLDIKKDIKNMSLLELMGFKETDIKNNSIQFKDNRQKEILYSILELSKKNKSGYNITGVDVHNVTSINIRVNDIIVKIGTEYNLKEKLNKALNIIRLHGIKDKKGYIDVSYDGNPVVNVN
ncbi:FtsQ-type POTRA domain-containing protein [Hathewaya histolytica]|uniref:Cell division septal protein divIB/FtsQ n=1 Tax=Hathewaya histolytica TaxID=1498 RepID=A0A4V6KCV3_HATHI|nr:FtsQ-type POTRA domain-containing protein [Hathewaya histolytica]VTQ87907.1 cell division septal protein divIB/FtsQ [Hathewaya histolytica]